MKASDFEDHNITNYTPAEVRRTGAMLEDVQLETIISLQKFRNIVARRVALAHNGITTGDHSAKEHPLGLAVDGYMYPADGPISTLTIFKAGLTAGFRGIGIYWNGLAYSFHLDLREDFGFWGGYKNIGKGEKTWTYTGLLVNLEEIGLF